MDGGLALGAVSCHEAGVAGWRDAGQPAGSLGGYQGIFAALAAQQSRLWPNQTVSRAVCLYVAAFG
jgi:hypothetical protein